MIDSYTTHPLTDFLRNAKAHLAQLKETRIPTVLTVNGQPEAVVLDAKSYEEMQAKLEQEELIEAVKVGLKDVEEGRTKPMDQVFDELEERYGLL